MNLRDLPRDSRGYLVPAESPWTDDGPRLSETEPLLKFLLAAHRACAVCGYPMPKSEPVWRIFDHDSRRTTLQQIAQGAVTDFDVPGHLVCMLYSALVCPYWRTPGGRLGRDTMFTPGAARGAEPSIMSFQDYGALIARGREIGGPTGQPAFFMLKGYAGELRFEDPLAELQARYDAERTRVGGRYVTGKRWHYAPQFGGRKRLTRDGVAMVKAIREHGPDGSVMFEGQRHGIFAAGWV